MADAKKKPEAPSVFREPRLKQARTEQPGELRMPHDDLIKSEPSTEEPRVITEQSAGESATGFAPPPASPVVEEGSSLDRDSGVEREDTRRTSIGERVRPVLAPAVVPQVSFPAAAADVDEAWGTFDRRFGSLLTKNLMRICELVYEGSVRSGTDGFDTTSEGLARLVGIKQRNTFALLDQLERLGFLKRVKIEEGKRQLGLRLTLNLNPFSENLSDSSSHSN